jgi:hypothetical protein
MEKSTAPSVERFGALRRNWTRISRPESVKNQGGWSVQDQGEEEAMRDLEKPIEQLLSDVHEQGFKSHTAKYDAENVIHAVRRSASMMAQVALTNRRVSRAMLVLSVILGFLALAQVALAGVQIYLMLRT